MRVRNVMGIAGLAAASTWVLVACVSVGEDPVPAQAGGSLATGSSSAQAPSAPTRASSPSGSASRSASTAPSGSDSRQASSPAGTTPGKSTDTPSGGGGDTDESPDEHTHAPSTRSTPTPEPAPSPTQDVTPSKSPESTLSGDPDTTQTDQSWWTDPANGRDSIPEGWPSGLPQAGGYEPFAQPGPKCIGNTMTFDQAGMIQRMREPCPIVVVNTRDAAIVLTYEIDELHVSGTSNEVGVKGVNTVYVEGRGNRVAYGGHTPTVIDDGTGNVVSTRPLAGPNNVG